jgi:hypothetical protein
VDTYQGSSDLRHNSSVTPFLNLPLARQLKKPLQTVYDLACEASFCNSYFEMDGNQVVGRRQDILDALNLVRKVFRLKGKVER